MAKRRKSLIGRRIPYRLAWYNGEELDEFADVGGPENLGRRRPRLDEWGDYIEEEQMLHIENLKCGLLNDISHMKVKEIRKVRTLGKIGAMKHGPHLKNQGT